MGIRRRILEVFSAVLLTLSLPGCWGNEDINDLALVMSVGIDQGDTPKTVKVTVQIANPANAIGQSGSSSGASGSPSWTATAQGESLFEAIRNLGTFTSKRIYWGHNKLIVFGYDYAKHGVHQAIDFFTRNHELRMRTWVAVADGDAASLIATPTGLQSISAESIDKLFRYSRTFSGAPEIDMRILQAASLRRPTAPVMPMLRMSDQPLVADEKGEFDKPQVELEGAAFFMNDKLAGTLSKNDTHGLTWFVRQAQTSRIIALPCPDEPDKSASLEMKSANFRTQPFWHHGKVMFQIHLKARLDLVEIGCKREKSTLTLLPSLQKEADETLKREIVGVVETAQSNGCDFLMLSQVFRRKYPAQWESMKNRWPDVFKSAKIHVAVTTDIYNAGLLQLPSVSDQNGLDTKEDPVL